MPRYRVTTPAHKNASTALQFSSLDTVGDTLRAAGFEGCTVWKYEPRARHWGIIFDTSVPDASRLPGSLYWCNTTQNEKAR
jgi:hypothetical protein